MNASARSGAMDARSSSRSTRAFAKALATIVDTNVTTLIAAAVLFYLGTGPVKGFAVTLRDRHRDDGLHRLHPDALAGGRMGEARPSQGTAESTRYALSRRALKIPFMGIRRWTFALSILLSIASVVLSCHARHELWRRLQGRFDHRGQGQGRQRRSGRYPRRLSELNIGEVQVQQIRRLSAKC